MRLFKLMAYALFGYALYEFIRGMTQAPGSMGGGMGRSMGGGSSQSRAFGDRAQNMTGPGVGTNVQTQEPDGGGMTHTVGRGVVS